MGECEEEEEAGRGIRNMFKTHRPTNQPSFHMFFCVLFVVLCQPLHQAGLVSVGHTRPHFQILAWENSPHGLRTGTAAV